MPLINRKFLDRMTPRTLSWAESVALACLLAGTVLIVGRVLRYCRHGFEFVDEGTYLNWLAHPFEYKISTTEFGYVYHPLYLALKGDVAALRAAMVILTFGLATCFSLVFLRRFLDKLVVSTVPLFILATSLATLSLSWYYRWVSIPTYNTLNLQAMFIVLSGALLAEKQIKGSSLVGWSLIGLGGYLSFMAKPTSAALLGLVTAVYLIFAGKLRLRPLALALSVAASGFILGALLIDGSLVAFIERLYLGAVWLFAKDTGHRPEDLLRIHQVTMADQEIVRVLVYSLVIATLAMLVQSKLWLAKVVQLAVAPGVFLTLVGMATAKVNLPLYYLGLSFLSLALVVPLAALLTGWCCRTPPHSHVGKKGNLALTVILLFMPPIFAFGTNRNYWFLGVTFAAVFWLFCGLTALARVPTRERLVAALIPLCAAAQLSAMLWIDHGIQHPVNQPERLPLNDVDFNLGEPSSHLILHRETAAYLTHAISASAAAGWRPGQSMIDLSGFSPGLLYALGAISKAEAWITGGFPGTDARTAFILRQGDCASLGAAWILDEPGGPRRISPGVLASFGADLVTDYVPVADFYTVETPVMPAMMGPMPPITRPWPKERRHQLLLKPTRSPAQAEEACKNGSNAAAQH